VVLSPEVVALVGERCLLDTMDGTSTNARLVGMADGLERPKRTAAAVAAKFAADMAALPQAVQASLKNSTDRLHDRQLSAHRCDESRWNCRGVYEARVCDHQEQLVGALGTWNRKERTQQVLQRSGWMVNVHCWYRV
jgi:hypothetical protein